MSIKRKMPAIRLDRPKGLRVYAEATPPEAQLKELAAQMKKVTDDLKGFAEQAQKEIKATGEMSAELKAKADEVLAKQTELDGRMREVEQKLARRGGAPEQPKTIGETVIEAEEVKAFVASRPSRGSVKVPIKAAITSAPASGGALVEEDRRPGIITPALRQFTIRQLLMPGRTSSNTIEYVQESGFTNNAAPVSEGVQKPESNITFELVTTPVRTIAHWVHATKQILDDAPMLTSYVDGRLRFGLAFVEEEQLLMGDGTGQNLHGLVPQASAYSPAFVVPNESNIDVIRLALLQVTLAEYTADAIVLHPTDWARIELTKDQEGRYILANPQQLTGPTLWGRPVVATQAMTEDEFLVGAFRLGAQVFDREDASVEISTEDRDNFVKNMVTIRCEERLALAVYRPEAFITGDFGNVT